MTELARVEKDAQEAMDVAYEARNKIDTHDTVCEQRYKGIQDGMVDIKSDIKTLAARMWIASGSVIAACVALIIILLTKGV
jgi:hypothetical protein